jgi:hypothetical protein
LNKVKAMQESKIIEEDYFELEIKQEALLDTAYHNEWYKWAHYTVKQATERSCLLRSPSPLRKLRLVPNKYDYMHCARFTSKYCDRIGRIVPYCPADCLAMLGNNYYQSFFNQSGWGSECQKLDVRVAENKREIPENYILDRSLSMNASK